MKVINRNKNSEPCVSKILIYSWKFSVIISLYKRKNFYKSKFRDSCEHIQIPEYGFITILTPFKTQSDSHFSISAASSYMNQIYKSALTYSSLTSYPKIFIGLPAHKICYFRFSKRIYFIFCLSRVPHPIQTILQHWPQECKRDTDLSLLKFMRGWALSWCRKHWPSKG